MPNQPGTKAILNVEIPRDLKIRLVAFAADLGISQAAATKLLLDQGLSKAGYGRKP